MKKWQIGKLGLVLLAGILMAGCGKTKEEAKAPKYTIGVVTKSKSSEYWMSVCSGMEDAAEKENAEVVILSPDSETDQKTQQKMIKDLLKMPIDALAVSTVNSYDNADYIELAKNRGIEVYAYDTPVSDVVLPYVGIDDEKVGYELGQAMAKKLNGTGKVAVIAGRTTQACHEKRILGFKRCMEEYPDIQIEVVKTGYSNLLVSEKDMKELLEEYPDLDGIMTTSAVTALGVAEATKESGILVVTVDAQEDSIEGVKDGKFLAVGAQSGYDIGYETIEYMIESLEKNEIPGEKILDTKILTIDNIDEYSPKKKTQNIKKSQSES